jgi:magnesium chelatase family protein
MLAKVRSASVVGIDAYPVEVEVDITSRGLPHFSMVGLPDVAVKESRDRVRPALKNIGFNFPLKQITVLSRTMLLSRRELDKKIDYSY